MSSIRWVTFLLVTLSAAVACGTASNVDVTGPQVTFAPTDAAFEALGDAELRSLEEGPWFTSVLHRHMVPDLLRLADLETRDLTSDGGIVEVRATGNRTTYGGAEIVDPTIEAANGVIHAIDGLVPDHLRSTISSG